MPLFFITMHALDYHAKNELKKWEVKAEMWDKPLLI